MQKWKLAHVLKLVRESEALLRYYVCDTIVFCGKNLTLIRNEIMLFLIKNFDFLFLERNGRYLVCNLNVLFKLWNLKGKPYSRNDTIFRTQGYIYETTQLINWCY